MSDDETPKPPDPIVTAPVVHSDELWGGPRFITNFGPDPIWVETKEQYWALCRQHGVRMHNQQESTTGVPTEAPPVVVPDAVRAPIVVPPMGKDEAHVFGAISAIFRRYGLVESVWCDDCFARDRPHGCRVRVNTKEVFLECRCGVAHYKAPTGTTDLELRTFANLTHTAADQMTGFVNTPIGPEFRPTTRLQAVEALVIRNYMTALRRRGKEPRWHHKGCWSGDPRNEDDAVGLKVTSEQIVVICPCRLLYEQRVATPTVVR